MKKSQVYFWVLLIVVLITIIVVKTQIFSKPQEKMIEQIQTKTAIMEEDSMQGIKGIELIKDEEFISRLNDFLVANSKPDYMKLYHFFSKSFIIRCMPEIKNADDYLDLVEYNAERVESKYLEILECNKIGEDKYQIDLIMETNNEGILQKMTVRYFFIKEDELWMYDGEDLDFTKWEDLN